MKRTVLFTFVALSLLFVLSVTTFASTERIRDPHSLLAPSDVSELESELRAAEERCGVPIRVYLNDRSKNFIFGEYEIEELYGYSDTVVLLIEKMSAGYYEYELFTYGDAYSYISDSAALDILDDDLLYSSVKGGRLSEGVSRFATLAQDKVSEGLRSRKNTVIIVAAIVALLGGGIAFGSVFFVYKRKLKSQVYPLSKYAAMTLDHSTDNFIGSNVVRTRVSSSSSGGRGSGGGGGSRGRR